MRCAVQPLWNYFVLPVLAADCDGCRTRMYLSRRLNTERTDRKLSQRWVQSHFSNLRAAYALQESKRASQDNQASAPVLKASNLKSRITNDLNSWQIEWIFHLLKQTHRRDHPIDLVVSCYDFEPLPVGSGLRDLASALFPFLREEDECCFGYPKV